MKKVFLALAIIATVLVSCKQVNESMSDIDTQTADSTAVCCDSVQVDTTTVDTVSVDTTKAN